jgi:hypothetical protein
MEDQAERSPEQLVLDYLAALDARDLEKCMSFFAEDAVINFMEGLYKGEEAIRQWHQDRFEAELRVLSVEDIRTEGDSIRVSAVIRSNRLLGWKIPKLSGYAQARVRTRKITELIFGLNVTNPLEDWS